MVGVDFGPRPSAGTLSAPVPMIKFIYRAPPVLVPRDVTSSSFPFGTFLSTPCRTLLIPIFNIQAIHSLLPMLRDDNVPRLATIQG